MTITLIILAYVANVFFNRWLNKVIYDNNILDDILWVLWFIPFATTIIFILVLLANISEITRTNWFNGKHWKR